ncbi:MAG: S9 family peptidase [Candidatus Levybacteria bacterium]|nr:S9 family peptidase [Candidatus Levybacteria bacterium]
MRIQEYPGSEITIEQTLPSGSNYERYIVSYKSDGLKIYALLTIPQEDTPNRGWPVIIFNHGYIPPKEYRTTEKYIAYTDAFSRAGYVVLKPDYRGHGSSEGEAAGGYGSPAYTIDVLNAVSSIKRLGESVKGEGGRDLTLNALPFPLVDANRIGMWGHSMGGFITLRSMVVSKDIKAGVIWGGVVASYEDLVYNWRRSTFTPSPLPSGARRWRDLLITRFGTPAKNPAFWESISANSYLKDISGPIQLHHGTADASVPIEFSEKLEKELKAENKTVELVVYPEDDHNIANNFNVAITRSVEFFDKYLKRD